MLLLLLVGIRPAKGGLIRESLFVPNSTVRQKQPYQLQRRGKRLSTDYRLARRNTEGVRQMRQ
ncbi:MAG: hypothetical protein Q4G66_06845 [bacterium]|nr:hypothetical protein [bacterium]